jgi:hypothetical protein
VVVTLVDSTQTKQLEAELYEAREELARLRGVQGEAPGAGQLA